MKQYITNVTKRLIFAVLDRNYVVYNRFYKLFYINICCFWLVVPVPEQNSTFNKFWQRDS